MYPGRNSALLSGASAPIKSCTASILPAGFWLAPLGCMGGRSAASLFLVRTINPRLDSCATLRNPTCFFGTLTVTLSYAAISSLSGRFHLEAPEISARRSDPPRRGDGSGRDPRLSHRGHTKDRGAADAALLLLVLPGRPAMQYSRCKRG